MCGFRVTRSALPREEEKAEKREKETNPRQGDIVKDELVLHRVVLLAEDLFLGAYSHILDDRLPSVESCSARVSERIKSAILLVLPPPAVKH